MFIALPLLAMAPHPAFAHGDLHDAIEEMSEAIADSPRDAGLYFHRAELHRLQHDWAEAEADYASAENLAPSMHIVLFGRAQLRRAQGDNEASLQLLDAFLRHQPAHPGARALRAEIREGRGEWEQADADLAVAVASSPEPHYASLRAALLQRHGKTAEAIQCLDEASAGQGRIPVLEQQALAIEEQAGLPEAALTRLDRFIDMEPRPDIWLVRKARLLDRLGRNDEAQAAWRQAATAFAGIPPEKRSLDINRMLAADIVAALQNNEEVTP